MLHYTIQGKGNTIVLLHGFCETHTIWSDFAQQLALSYQVVCIDLSGFGQSPLLAVPPSMAAYAIAVHETLQALALKDYVMIGHSLGGYVTLSYAEQFAEHLKGFGLFNSTALADSPEKQENRNKVITALQEYGAEAFVKTFYYNLFAPNNKEKFETTIQNLIQEGKQIPTQALIAATQAMRDRKEQLSLLQKTTLPVLFIVGTEDPVIPYATVAPQFALPQNAIVHLAAYGHMGMLEAPQATLQAIRLFMGYCWGNV
ncbi:MAG: alpha/beta fold hydrolase [Thermoflexibacteraceae bacterium]